VRHFQLPSLWRGGNRELVGGPPHSYVIEMLVRIAIRTRGSWPYRTTCPALLSADDPHPDRVALARNTFAIFDMAVPNSHRARFNTMVAQNRRYLSRNQFQ